VIRWFEHHKVYAPLRQMLVHSDDLPHACQEVRLQAADQTSLHGWYFPAISAGSPETPVILYLHGNGGNLSTRIEWYGALLETGAHVFSIDYRGYGLSEGVPSEEGTYLDAQAAFHWLHQRGHHRIVALGESLGGGVAAELAVREKLAGLILVNTFTSVTDLGQEMFPWLPVRWFNTIRYHTVEKLARLPRLPVLILHSSEDRLIDIKHAHRNYEAALRNASVLKRLHLILGGHNEPLAASHTEVVGVIRLFLDDLCPVPDPSACSHRT